MLKYTDGRSIRVLAFLEAYERQTCLWDTTLDSYKNKLDRDQAYMAIIKELNVPSLTVHDIKLKVKGIRTTYTKELRILNAHKRLGKAYKPKLFWFNRANSFLKNVCVSRRRKEFCPKLELESQPDCKDYTVEYGDEPYDGEEMEAVNELNDDEQSQNNENEQDFKAYMQVVNEDETEKYQIKEQQTPIYIEQSYDEPLPTPPPPTQPSTDNPRINNNKHEVTTNTFDVSPSPALKEDEFDLFCRSVAGQLRAIPDSYSRSLAKLKIQQILFEAETGHYKNSPCITIPIVQQINGV
ncbi:uncharacterized protein LOC129910873 [Episyrphus balteatus]|uniref:uncharacterized protein LOC129910873 n=1 Tax=Episyrphus balteatus TaxID=286459 RepID=UPI002486A232|nr:uncharacterized protein LOC129910873 [Episyrphus balteatus]